jgi:E3 ubiquitin-protein ligase RNF115/126
MSEVSEAVTTTRYWCHFCAQAVMPTMEPEIKCPYCDSGFVEEMQGSDFESTTSDLRSERALSLWAPILLGMVDDNGSGSTQILRRPVRREQPEDDFEEDDDDYEEEDDQIEREIEDIFRRSQRRSAIFQLLESLRDDDRDRERERERDGDDESLILINSNDQAIILQGNFNSEDNTSESGSGLADYFLGPGLDLLLQHLSENDPNRYGTPPAMKEAIEALPCMRIEVASICAVCLDDFEISTEAKELPCKHHFHGGCILPWLELHSTCPVCRYQLPAEETKDNGESTGEGTGESVSVGTGEIDNRHENRSWLNELFSSSDGSQPNTSTDLIEEQD